MLTKKLDQYYTKPAVAKRLFLVTEKIIKQYEPDLSKFFWIEPSAGAGAFYDCLPPDKRIGIEIDPPEGETRFLKMSFYNYWFVTKPYIVIGNPPFGRQGKEALGFIKKSKEADFIAMILPPCFLYTYRLKVEALGFNLLYEEEISKENTFITKNNKPFNIYSVFQIYSKNYHLKKDNKIDWEKITYNPYQHLLRGYFLRDCNYRRFSVHDIRVLNLNRAYPNFFLAYVFFKNDKHFFYNDFEEIAYKQAWLIIFKTKDMKTIKKIRALFKKTDWLKYAYRRTHGSYGIRLISIYRVLYDNGFEPRWKRDLFNENL